MLFVYTIFIFVLLTTSNQVRKDPPESCQQFDVAQIPEDYQGSMGDLWIVTHITPKGKSLYSDGSTACGLYNFNQHECKCLRYSISMDEHGSIIRKTIGLDIKSKIFRYIESRVVFVEDYFDVFQAEVLLTAVINFEGTKSSLTKSPLEEEIYREYQPYALLATDNYETYAVYASCVPSPFGPLAWIAFSEAAYVKNRTAEVLPKIKNILMKNGIDYENFEIVDQQHCRPKI